MTQNSSYFAFSRPVDSFYKSKQSFPLHVFSKTLSDKILDMNELQLAYFNFKNIADVRGFALDDLVIRPQFTLPISANDREVVKYNMPMFFLEPFNDSQFLALKTCLFDSKNHLAGVFGFGFYLESTPLIQILEYINRLQLFALPQSLLTNILQFPIGKGLTSREKECAAYLIKGYSSKEIGKALTISYRTVEQHLDNMKFKLNCKTKTQLVAKLLEEKIKL